MKRVDMSYEANRHDYERSDDERETKCKVCGFWKSHPYHQTPVERAVAERNSK